MTTFEYYEAAMENNCRRATAADVDEFNQIESMLPKRQEGDCGYCGPHSYLPMRMALDMVKPKSILEIGFNLGHSSLFWLRRCMGRVVSIDVKEDERVRAAVEVCKKEGEFRFILRGSENWSVGIGEFELAFIDGSHAFNDVLFDIQWCKNLKIPYLLLDDWLTLYGEVQRAVIASGLKILWVSGNQALVTTSEEFSHYYAL